MRNSNAVANLPVAMSAFEEERRGRGRGCVQDAGGDRLLSNGRTSEECAPEVGGGSGRYLPATLAKASNTQYRQGNVPETERLLGNTSTINVKEKINIFQSLRQCSDEVPADKGFERELLPLRPA
ncbi:hypothetical protein NDU88_006819 [Pleurodeles waltl]|uniref:Uncharacterized protein n=1 Tax=Pleurodeles waltl TaxID=8319 RepID=A0AAV7UP72_PLEWA|nr:hypothetical protein NDU88_006819 [Pleurodeles waltl]